LNTLQSIILGIIQGLTEFFPISSSGHLVLIPFFFNWESPPLYYIVTVHFGTLVAILSIFYREVYRIIKAFFLGIFIKSKRSNNYFKFAILIIIASIPSILLGFFLEKYIDKFFYNPLIAAAFLIITAIILLAGEKRGKNIKIKNVKNNAFIAFIIGLGQAIAILPGISRSGATISFARFFGIKRTECVKFSFLLSIPVIFGSFIFEIYKSHSIIFNGSFSEIKYLIIGFIFSCISGFFAIKFIVYLTRSKNLNVFAIYCVVLAIITFVVVYCRSF